MGCWNSKAYYTSWLCGRKNLKVIRFYGKATWFKTIKYFKLICGQVRKKLNFVDPSNMKPLWLIEICKKKHLLLIEAKKPIAQVLFLGRLSPYGKYIFWGELDSSIERYVAVAMKMNTVLMFSPQKKFVEISFFWGENPFPSDSFSITWVNTTSRVQKG